MTNYKILITKQAQKDKQKIKSVVALEKNCRKLIELIAENPFAQPPFYETLVGDLKGAYSRRINIQHRLVYSVNEELKEITILRMWSHYE